MILHSVDLKKMLKYSNSYVGIQEIIEPAVNFIHDFDDSVPFTEAADVQSSIF